MTTLITRYSQVNAGISALVALLACCFQTSPAMASSTPYNLIIGFSSQAFVNVPKDDVKIAVRVLTQKVAKKSAVTAESRVYDSILEIEKDLKSKRIDVVALAAEEFLHLKTHEPLEPLMISVSGKYPEVDLYLLTRKDSGIKSFSDLRHKTIALPSKTSQFGGMYHIWVETLVMKERSESLDDFFSSLKETRNASQAAMAVFFRKVDACVISRQVFEVLSELNPQISRELKTIVHINRLTSGIIAMRRDLSDELKLKVRQALTTLSDDQEGQQMFTLFQLSGLAPFKSDYLKGTEALYAEHQKLKSKMVRK